MKRTTISLIALVCLISSAHAESLTAILHCGARSADAQHWPAYNAPITFKRNGNALSGQRSTSAMPGREVYRGTVSGGEVKIAATGEYFGRSKWTKSFSGSAGAAIISGDELDQYGETRSCSLTFSAPLR
jgi:hypothetical protein